MSHEKDTHNKVRNDKNATKNTKDSKQDNHLFKFILERWCIVRHLQLHREHRKSRRRFHCHCCVGKFYFLRRRVFTQISYYASALSPISHTLSLRLIVSGDSSSTADLSKRFEGLWGRTRGPGRADNIPTSAAARTSEVSRVYCADRCCCAIKYVESVYLDVNNVNFDVSFCVTNVFGR